MGEWITGPTILSFVAAGCALGAAIWSGVEQNRQLVQIIDKQQASLDYLTGGDSYFHLHFDRQPDGTLRARQITHGNNPIREVRVEPFNYTEFLRHSGEPWMDSQIAARQILKIGTVKPKAATYLVDFKFPDDGIADYAISIDASNGEYIELASFRRLADGTNVAAYRFFRILGREDKQINIVEMPERFHADDGFPRDESGKLEWLDYPEKWKPLNLHVVPAEN